MTLNPEYDFRADVISVLDLVALDTTEGMVRLWLGEDGFFTDTDGNVWTGSKLLTMGEVEYSINGSAPTITLGFSFIQDPDSEDLVAAVSALGVAAVKGRPAYFYIQYLRSLNEFYKPFYAPDLITQRVMTNIDYVFDGPQIRGLSLTVEAAFNLRSKAPGGRYNTVDHSRRVGSDNPSLEFMPTNGFDDEPLFGL